MVDIIDNKNDVIVDIKDVCIKHNDRKMIYILRTPSDIVRQAL